MMPHPLRVLRTLPAPVRLLVAGSFVNKLGTFIIPYLTLVLRKDFQLEDAAAARLLLAYGGGSLVSIVVGGVLTDHLGRRLTLLLSLLGSGVIAVVAGLRVVDPRVRAAPGAAAASWPTSTGRPRPRSSATCSPPRSARPASPPCAPRSTSGSRWA